LSLDVVLSHIPGCVLCRLMLYFLTFLATSFVSWCCTFSHSWLRLCRLMLYSLTFLAASLSLDIVLSHIPGCVFVAWCCTFSHSWLRPFSLDVVLSHIPGCVLCRLMLYFLIFLAASFVAWCCTFSHLVPQDRTISIIDCCILNASFKIYTTCFTFSAFCQFF